MATLLDILDEPEDRGHPSQYKGWILVATLTPEEVGNLVLALEEAEIEEENLYFHKEMPSKVGNIIVPLTAHELGNIKTMVYVAPESVDEVMLIVDLLPEPEPFVSSLSAKDLELQRLWMRLVIGLVIVLVIWSFLRFMQGETTLFLFDQVFYHGLPRTCSGFSDGCFGNCAITSYF